MAHDFPYTFGIEEELFLSHRQSRNACVRLPKGLVSRCRRRFGERVSHELLQGQIEVATGILSDPVQALAELRELRHGIAEVAAPHDLLPLSASTHPLAEWREQQISPEPRYAQLCDDFQIIGRRNLFCGLHVHVAIPPGVDRIVVMNRLLPWLPLLLALSTSSPFWSRQRSGLMSYRQAGYDEWPRTGIPDHFRDEPEYQYFVDLLVRSQTLPNASFLWWAIRPSLRFPTLELRITDACTRVVDSVCIASVFRCLVRAVVEQTTSVGPPPQPWTRALIDENRWRAKRFGLDTDFIDIDSGGQRSAADWIVQLRRTCAPHAEHLGCLEQLDQVDRIIAQGSSAHRQLSVYRLARDRGLNRVGAMREVVDWLTEQTLQ